MKKAMKYLMPPVAALLVTLIIALGALDRVDRWVQDSLFQHPGVTSGDIIIIGIDEEAISELGPYNTWDRTVMAAALEALAADPENRPAAVAVDVLYAGSTSPEADARLAAAAESLGCVVTAAMAEFGQRVTWENGRAASLETGVVVNYLEAYEALREVTVSGHINAVSDSDSVMRHALLYVEPSGASGPRVYSMACQAARLYLERRGQALTLPPTDRSQL